MFRVLLLLGLLLPQITLAQSTNGILAKHFEKCGQDQWNEIRTIQIDGKWVDKDYHAYSMQLTAKAPDKVRIEGSYKGKNYVESYTGLFGWIMAPWKESYKIQKMDDEDELIIRNVFSFGSPLYSVKDHLEFTGLMDMEGVLYNTFTLSEGDMKKIFYLDRDDHNLYYERIESRFGREAITVTKIYEKYKSYGPLTLPTAVRFKGLGLDREFVFDEALLGIGANDALFDLPKGQ
ncbi:MAG: hypothetical protein RIC35_03535 [Marinoscillum sp.]